MSVNKGYSIVQVYPMEPCTKTRCGDQIHIPSSAYQKSDKWFTEKATLILDRTHYPVKYVEISSELRHPCGDGPWLNVPEGRYMWHCLNVTFRILELKKGYTIGADTRTRLEQDCKMGVGDELRITGAHPDQAVWKRTWWVNNPLFYRYKAGDVLWEKNESVCSSHRIHVPGRRLCYENGPLLFYEQARVADCNSGYGTVSLESR